MIRFYFHPTPNPAKVALLLEELGAPYELMPVDTAKGEQHAAAFRAINPNGKVPAIVDTEGPGGREARVFDSSAILLYLGEKAGRFGPADRQELLDDYCQLAIYDQETAGLDALTDGEHRRGGWIEGITGQMAGLALKPAARRLGSIGWDQLPVYEVREPLAHEIAATLVLRMPIIEWSMKVSDGWPTDDDDDVAGPAWAGVIIDPTAAQTNMGSYPGTDPSHVIGQAGLSTGYTSGVTNYATYLASNPSGN